MALRSKWYDVWFHVSCLVHCLDSVWYFFQGWDVGTQGSTLVGVSLRTPGYAPEACGIHPTHPVHFVACTSEA